MLSNSVCNHYLSEQIGFVGLEVDSHVQFHLITCNDYRPNWTPQSSINTITNIWCMLHDMHGTDS